MRATRFFPQTTAAVLGLWMVLASCTPPAQVATQTTNPQAYQTLRVMSYNIHHCNPLSKPKVIDVDAIVATIKSQTPDLVALQEVDVNTKRSGSIHQAQVIAEKLGMHYFFGKALEYDGGEYGVAILSKFPLEETRVVPLPVKEGTKAEPRAVAFATVKLSKNRKIIFGSTHLDEKGNPENRLLQLEALGRIRFEQKLPFIIAGDFNATPGSESIQRLDVLFQRTCQDCPPTFPITNSTKAIDFIAFSPAEKFSVATHQVVQETYASDHLPIVSVIEVLR
ncbi:MAG: endonuclease/exonuclease/phosphatase family protein [Rufibacter sp.]